MTEPTGRAARFRRAKRDRAADDSNAVLVSLLTLWQVVRATA
jgi:hypothetical protein